LAKVGASPAEEPSPSSLAETAGFDYPLLSTPEGWDIAMQARRLIEDYLPIEAISSVAGREKSLRRGHISSLHQWWARRPLVACRAAIYAALVPADAFPAHVTIHDPPEDPRETAAIKEDLARGFRRGQAGEFIKDLCKYPGDPQKLAEAEHQILATHTSKLSAELGRDITVQDIVQGDAPRPRVLDMFAGGGSIPLEALRLGCEAFALELNPVAHLIELCTLVYPQKFGQPDPSARGCAKDGTWAGLAEEVRHWGRWVLERARAEVGDLYPPMPDPGFKGPSKTRKKKTQLDLFGDGQAATGAGQLTPVAYLWTRTVRCKNPSCGATVPLVRQTWLRKKGRCAALKVVPDKQRKRVRFELVEAASEGGLGFDPAGFSKGGNSTCPFCGTVADTDYIMAEGAGHRIGHQAMAIVCTRTGEKGKIYIAADQARGPGQRTRQPDKAGDEPLRPETLAGRIKSFCARTGLSVPEEPINSIRPSPNSRGLSPVTRYGMTEFGLLFSERQLLCLLAFCRATRDLGAHLESQKYDAGRARAIGSYAALLASTLADWNSTFTSWTSDGEFIGHTFTRHALAMVWDYVEVNPFGNASGNATDRLERTVAVIGQLTGGVQRAADCRRGSALSLPWPGESMDAVITDPPYYDNVPYADISDYFYVWLKRAIGPLYPEHFASELTPKKSEVTALASHYGGDMVKATRQYEEMMLTALREASRVLKQGGQLVVVYAHKTTLGWSTLVDSIRKAGFTVVEAWPLDTERAVRMVAMEAAALASSIFLVGHKRNGAGTGSYEAQVRPALETIVRERVQTLWKMGIAGADLIIAAVGAGLRAFTQQARVEFANGEEVPATTFLREVEGVVHEALLEKIFDAASSRVATVDSASRFYVLWRYTYGAVPLDAGEAIVFTYGLDVELDNVLCAGGRALVEKQKATYRLRDFTERGEDRRLGLPDDSGKQATLIDILHRVLWLIEHEPRGLPRFLKEAEPDRERLRALAQTLAAPALKATVAGEAAPAIKTTPREQAALGKLLANWRTLMPDHAPLFGRKET
jgi:putative DNA methylase